MASSFAPLIINTPEQDQRHYQLTLGREVMELQRVHKNKTVPTSIIQMPVRSSYLANILQSAAATGDGTLYGLADGCTVKLIGDQLSFKVLDEVLVLDAPMSIFLTRDWADKHCSTAHCASCSAPSAWEYSSWEEPDYPHLRYCGVCAATYPPANPDVKVTPVAF